jgi:dTMP kinase
MFIQIEGIDGVGKTTQSILLREWMVVNSMPVVIVKELESTNLGKRIKEILVQGTLNIGTAEMFLFLASKAQAFSEIILPTLARGESVIADRGNGSFISYNASLGIDKQMLIYLLDTVNLGVVPDLTVLLDMSATIAKKRIESRTRKTRFDLINETQMERQRYQFLSLAEILPNWVIINGDIEKEAIHQRIVQEIKGRH